MTYDEIDNLLETILFDDLWGLRLVLQELEQEGVILAEERISLMQSLVE